MIRLSRLIMASVITGFAVWCALSLRADLSQMSFSPLWKSWNMAVLAITFTFLNYALRVTRWRWYLARLGHLVPVGFAALTYLAGFAFTLSPGKLGELIKARYYTAIGIPLRDVMAVFWAERVLDICSLLLLTVLVLGEFPRYQDVLLSTGLLIAIGAALLVFVPSSAIVSFLNSPRTPKVIAAGAARVLSSLEIASSLLVPRPIVVGLLTSLAAWSLEGLGLGVLGSIFSPVHSTAPTAVGIYAVAVLVGAISFLPGGLGSTETAMAALLISHGYSPGAALLTTLACRVTTLWLGVCLGCLGVAVLHYEAQQEKAVWPPSEP
jgi:uncharacterized membrane protein YbhN (UPF0104 family)